VSPVLGEVEGEEGEVNFKVIDGTAREGENLCATCRNAHIYKGARESSETVICGAPGVEPTRMLFPILSCNKYDDKRMPSRWDMEEIAWTLRTNKLGKAIGFTSPHKGEDQPSTSQPGFGFSGEGE